MLLTSLYANSLHENHFYVRRKVRKTSTKHCRCLNWSACNCFKFDPPKLIFLITSSHHAFIWVATEQTTITQKVCKNSKVNFFSLSTGPTYIDMFDKGLLKRPHLRRSKKGCHELSDKGRRLLSFSKPFLYFNLSTFNTTYFFWPFHPFLD